MGKCRFCGEPAGFLRHHHKPCQAAADEAYASIQQLLANFSHQSPHFEDLSDEVDHLVGVGKLTSLMKTGAIFDGLKRYVNASADIALPAAETAKRMQGFVAAQSLRQHVGIIYSPVLTKVDQIQRLSAIKEGKIAERPDAFINISASETQFWSAGQVKLYEDKAHSHREGGGHGVTVRVAKGVYMHEGKGRSHTVTHVTHDHIDTGKLVLSNRNLYFAGAVKSLKIPLASIVSINPCHDGAEIMRSGSRGKSEYFVTGDSWFLCRVISTAMHR